LSAHQIAPAKRFEAILKPHFDALYAAARRLTFSSVDAEDLVQDVCLKSFARLDELERIEYPRAWLLKMLYHKFIDNQRIEQRSPISIADTGLDSIEPDDLMQHESQPEHLADEEIRVARILMAMNRISDDQRSLVALRDIEGLSIKELQLLTGMPSGTIKAQLHRTRAKLGRILSSDETLKPHLKAIGGKS
jgi:RNA polymerase sigma factor (sigma-70 family)